jgi:AcrR family transcriptional regulator
MRSISGRASTENRRRTILAAALACFAEHGYEATTLGQIRERSGASVGSIYHLFASKEEIAGAVYLEGLRDYQDGFTAQIAKAESAEAAVRACVDYYLGWVEEHEQLARFMLHTRQAELVPTVREELRKMNRAFFRTIDEHLQRYTRALKEMPRELFVDVVMGPAQEHARHWLAGRSRMRPRDAATHLAEAAWDAVRSRRR